MQHNNHKKLRHKLPSDYMNCGFVADFTDVCYPSAEQVTQIAPPDGFFPHIYVFLERIEG
jgi:hypothetical protein